MTTTAVSIYADLKSSIFHPQRVNVRVCDGKATVWAPGNRQTFPVLGSEYIEIPRMRMSFAPGIEHNYAPLDHVLAVAALRASGWKVVEL